MWKEAVAAFNTGNFPHAADLLQKIISKSKLGVKWLNGQVTAPAPPSEKRLEPVFFMLGAAYFNAKDWPNAIKILTNYPVLFPTSDRRVLVKLSLAEAYLFGGQPDASIPIFTTLLPLPDLHERVLMLLVEANKKANKPEGAIALLEHERTVPNLNPDFREKVNMTLLPFYADEDDNDKSLGLMDEINADIGRVQNVTTFNKLATQVGDKFLAKNKIEKALGCYHLVRDNQQVISLQKAQIEKQQKKRANNLADIQALIRSNGNPLTETQLQMDNKDIDELIKKDQAVLAQYANLPPILPPLFLRISRAYFGHKDYWESAVVYRELMRRFSQGPEVESALYGSIIVFDKLKQTDRALGLCKDYLTRYPKGQYADSVAYLRGALAYDAEDFDNAITYFEDCLKTQPNNPRKPQIEVILGDIKLREGKFDEAIVAYQKYKKDNPNGADFEKAEYRSALSVLFEGKYDDADTALRAFMQKYPKSQYIPDAEYRLDVIKYAHFNYAEIIPDCLTWLKAHPTAEPRAEVLSLLGDTYTSTNQKDEAIAAYQKSFQASEATDPASLQVFNDSIFAAAKLLQTQGKWLEIAHMFQSFVNANPDHPTAVSAISWIGRADIKLGKVDEAKQYMGNAAKQYLDDRTREAVDEIITQLAQLYAHQHQSVAPPPPPPTSSAPTTPASASGAALSSAAPAAPASAPDPGLSSSAPSPAPTTTDPVATPPLDPADALEQMLTIPDLDNKPTARARLLFARAELARIKRKPAVEAQYLLEIAQQFKPEDLSPLILGQVGDCLFQSGRLQDADPFYHEIIDSFNQSPLVDYGYNGVAQIALDQKDYKTADKYFSIALNKGLAASKLKDITFGEARTLLAMKRLDEATTLFQEVASTREWRGEVTAESVYSLGEIKMDMADQAADKADMKSAQALYASANAYFQRVFVAYQKFPAVQAKAYLKSGEAFEKMGKVPEARNTYSELLRNPNLAAYPETSDAKDHLDNLPH